jgi:hypothetical protein
MVIAGLFVSLHFFVYLFHGKLQQSRKFLLNAMTTIEDLQALVAQSILSTEAFKNQIAASQEAADRRAAEAKAEADRRAAEADRRAAEVDKERKELRQQIGGLHNKFGTFAEGLLLPTVKRILRDELGMEQVSERTERNRKVDGKKVFMELDAFGYSNGEQNVACIVEIKSHLREDGIEQILRELREFPEFFRDHAGKRLYGMIAAVDASRDLQERVWKEGLFLVLVHDDVAELTVPEGFMPKNYGA